MLEIMNTGNYLGMMNTTGSLTDKKASSLQDTLKGVDTETASDEKLMDVCKSFESYFVQQVFEEMKKTVHSQDDENEYLKYFGDTYTKCISDSVTENGGVGLAKQLYESMKRNE